MHKFAQKSKQQEKIWKKIPRKKNYHQYHAVYAQISTNLHKIHEPWEEEDDDDESDKHIKARVLEVTRA